MKTTQLKHLAAALALGLAATGASATVLTFDELTSYKYGDDMPLTGDMHYDGKNLVYTQSGFQLTLNAPNSTSGQSHVGDAGDTQTYNWHDAMENGMGTYVTLTRVGGGLFDLTAFDYATEGFDVSVDGTFLASLEGYGSWNTQLAGIGELRLTGAPYGYNFIDNVDVEAAQAAVPLPGALALMLGGLAAGAVTRRRKK